MRLAIIYEASTRRDFLRQSATFVSGGPFAMLKSALGSGANKYIDAIKAWNNLDDRTAGAVDEFIFWLVNYAPEDINLKNYEAAPGRFSGGSLSINNGIVSMKNAYFSSGRMHEEDIVRFPIAAVIGKNLEETEDTDDILTNWFSGDDVELYNEIMPGILNDMIKVGASKEGPLGFAKKVSEYAIKEWGELEGPWYAILKQPFMKGLFDKLGLNASDLKQAASGDLSAMTKLIQNGIVDKNSAREWIGELRRRAHYAKEFEQSRKAQKELEQRNKMEREKQERKERERNEREEYDIPDDYAVASPMHQPFEDILFNNDLETLLEEMFG